MEKRQKTALKMNIIDREWLLLPSRNAFIIAVSRTISQVAPLLNVKSKENPFLFLSLCFKDVCVNCLMHSRLQNGELQKDLHFSANESQAIQKILTHLSFSYCVVCFQSHS